MALPVSFSYPSHCRILFAPKKKQNMSMKLDNFVFKKSSPLADQDRIMFILLLLVHAWSHSSPPGCTAALVHFCICVKLLSSVISVLAGFDLLFRDKSLCIFFFLTSSRVNPATGTWARLYFTSISSRKPMSECRSVTSRLQFSSRCRSQKCNFRGRAFTICGALLQAALSSCGSGCTSGLWSHGQHWMLPRGIQKPPWQAFGTRCD